MFLTQLCKRFFPAKLFRTDSLMATHSASASADEGAVIKIDTGQDYGECCIHRVPRNLRKVNEEAYTPQLISIGPYHYGKEELVNMEKHKRRYMLEFCQRISENKKKELEDFIEKSIDKIHRHYAEPFEFTKDKFVEIILCDTFFIIELFLRFLRRDRSDFLLNEVWLRAIRRDLQLLENQLPYFVLEDAFMLAFSTTMPFITLSCIFFQLHISHNIPPYMQTAVKIKHFTDLCRYALVKIPPYPKSRGIIRDGLPSAVRLKKSGVKFKRHRDTYLVNIILEKRKPPMSFCNVVELNIPRIEITDNMECLIRNLMVLELCYYPSESYICSYIDLMDSLINTESDVDLLVERGIIYNPSGDSFATANMFNKLQLQIPPCQFSHYSSIYDDLLNHYNSRWNHAMATLKSVYFSNPWRGTGTVAAFILLLLTLIQTVFSILQVVLRK